jgi:hypothetical protein
LVWRILDTFRVVQSSYERLDDAAKLEIGEHANGVLAFRGFDFNDEREKRLGRTRGAWLGMAAGKNTPTLSGVQARIHTSQCSLQTKGCS